jgi:hypothetical protein
MNKEVCKACFRSTFPRGVGFLPGFDEDWKEGRVWCVECMKYVLTLKYPRDCKYKVEHIMAEQA